MNDDTEKKDFVWKIEGFLNMGNVAFVPEPGIDGTGEKRDSATRALGRSRQKTNTETSALGKTR